MLKRRSSQGGALGIFYSPFCGYSYSEFLCFVWCCCSAAACVPLLGVFLPLPCLVVVGRSLFLYFFIKKRQELCHSLRGKEQDYNLEVQSVNPATSPGNTKENQSPTRHTTHCSIPDNQQDQRPRPTNSKAIAKQKSQNREDRTAEPHSLHQQAHLARNPREGTEKLDQRATTEQHQRSQI
jgi:cell division protein FtsN